MGKVESAAKATNAERVWKSMAEMFGPKFQDQFGPAPSEMWIDACSELTYVQVREALRKVRNTPSQWPPGLPEFMAYARSTDLRPLPTRKQEAESDKFTMYVDQFLWRYLCTKGAASPESLRKLIDAKNYWCDAYRTICEDEPEASLELRGKLMEAFDAAWEPMSTPDAISVAERWQRGHVAPALQIEARSSALPEQTPNPLRQTAIGELMQQAGSWAAESPFPKDFA